MNTTIKLSKSDKAVRAILAATYPEYRGRKVTAQIATTYYVENAWGGGSRSYAVAMDLATGKTAAAAVTVGPTIEIPSGVIIVEHSYFCGKDVGIRIFVRAEDMGRALAGAATTAQIAEVA